MHPWGGFVNKRLGKDITLMVYFNYEREEGAIRTRSARRPDRMFEILSCAGGRTNVSLSLFSEFNRTSFANHIYLDRTWVLHSTLDLGGDITR